MLLVLDVNSKLMQMESIRALHELNLPVTKSHQHIILLSKVYQIISTGGSRILHKGGCAIHLKGAPENTAPRGCSLGRGALCQRDPPVAYICIYIKIVSFYAFPVIFIDTVLFKKAP